MIEYRVEHDDTNNTFIVYGPFVQGSFAVEIPDSDPNRKPLVDLFLHKADIDRGIQFLRCISDDKTDVLNEALFIAGLNQCMKCFKYSKARSSLKKHEVFKNSEELLVRFEKFEMMRDKHFDHDESGMLQVTAFLLISPNEGEYFGGPPSVVWNRERLNYYDEGRLLQEVMRHTQYYLCRQIDELSALMESAYARCPKESLAAFKTAHLALASQNAKR